MLCVTKDTKYDVRSIWTQKIVLFMSHLSLEIVLLYKYKYAFLTTFETNLKRIRISLIRMVSDIGLIFKFLNQNYLKFYQQIFYHCGDFLLTYQLTLSVASSPYSKSNSSLILFSFYLKISLGQNFQLIQKHSNPYHLVLRVCRQVVIFVINFCF